MSFLSKIFGASGQGLVSRLTPLVERINGLEPTVAVLSDGALKEKTAELKKQLGQASSAQALEAVLPEAFALVREAAARTLLKRHFDVQLLGGIVLHQGKIAEMKTGEGKTQVATLSAYLNALAGRGVHVITVNDYLAKRDAVWMGQIYDALGLSVGCIVHEAAYRYDPAYGSSNPKSQIRSPVHFVRGSRVNIVPMLTQNSKQIPNPNFQIPNGTRDRERDTVGGFKVVESYLRPCTRKEAYAADVTYGTNNEFGFDYLRDNMAYDLNDMVQRGHHYAIVDEVDSILIDEARTPLIISMPDEESTKLYEMFTRIVPRLQENADYNIDEKLRAVTLSDAGIEKVEKILGFNMYEPGGVRYVHALEQSLRAHTLFKRDKDYVVKDGEVIIVDEFTGRLMPGRRWSEGLHQAIEAKERVKVEQESRTLAAITFQNYFRMYEKLSGMTGTALTSAEEFDKVYKLDVVPIPTNKSMIREDLPDRVYKTEQGKFQAVVEEIKERHERGQPVLVGTISIEKNERLSALLKREGIAHELLNAKNHEREGAIIAQAGRFGAVTVATNMAGRGVDIVFGGNPPDPREQAEVRRAGGLHVIGTQRHEARRIDNQLRGRSGRQGDPGSSQFFASLQDEIMRIFGGERLKSLMDRLNVPEDMPIEHSLVSKSIESAQAKIEGHNFDIRKHVLEYDEVMNKHRQTVYQRRLGILSSGNLEAETAGMVEEEVKKILNFHAAGDNPGEWNKEEIFEIVKAIAPQDEKFSSPSLRAPYNPSDVAAARSGAADDRREDATARSGAADDRREDAAARSGAADDRREDATARSGAADDRREDTGRATEGAANSTSLTREPFRVSSAAISPSKQLEELRIKDYELRNDLEKDLLNFFTTLYESRQQRFGKETIAQIEKTILLRTLDMLWVEHLETMEHLRDSVRLRAYGQRDPLVEYKNEARRLFEQLLASFQTNVVNMIFKVTPTTQSVVAPQQKASLPTDGRDPKNIGRNDPCWCGSGKKFKRCHWR